jgi:hypothetical protein
VVNVTKNSLKNLHFFMRVLKYGSKRVKEKAYLSIVRPKLEYASGLWDMGIENIAQSRKLDSVQRRAAKYVTGGLDVTIQKRRKKIEELTRNELKNEIRRRHGKVNGNKSVLMERLKDCLKEDGNEDDEIEIREYNYRSVADLIEKLKWEDLSERRKITRATYIHV